MLLQSEDPIAGDEMSTMPAKKYERSRQSPRRRQCTTVPDIRGMAQPRAARSATEGLVLSAITPGERLSVQGSAPNASRPGIRKTADGYVGFMPPDDSRHGAGLFWDSRFRNEEVTRSAAELGFALGGAT
jgi:hypothetical protein